MKLDYYLTPCTKIKPKWVKDLNVRPKTIKLLEENIVSFSNQSWRLGSDFLALTLKVRATKAKTNKWDDIRLKSHRTATETVSKMKRQPSEREELFASRNLITG